MKRLITIALGTLVVSAGAFAQDDAAIAKAVMPAPANQKATATVVKFKADGTYDTLRKGTGALVCYDKSGLPGQTPAVNIECTNTANLERAAQNIKFESLGDRAKTQAALDAAEKDGTRVKPGYGTVWYHMRGADLEHTNMHVTIAVPGATGEKLGLPENGRSGGVWVMNPGTSTAHLMTPGE